jgi:queuine tRNA-ribosyltransferase
MNALMDEDFPEMSFPKFIDLPHGRLQAPVYLPDATYGMVRAVDSEDLDNVGIQALVMNAFHMMQKPGSSTVQALGGLNQMTGWQKPIMTDSGGFQAYSLIRQNAAFGKLSEKGITFQPDGGKRKFQLTPEKSIQLQMGYGADIIVCLDDCTHADGSLAEQEVSVKRTVAWAKRCKTEFEKISQQKKLPPEQQPLLFGVIQGGGSFELRKQCADALLEIGFDGFGFGGWPLDGENNLLTDILEYTRSLVPPECPFHALGIGHPENVKTCFDMGYGMFDCAMPTRDARHGRLYIFTQPDTDLQAGLTGDWLKYVYINDEKHIKSSDPISPYCDCLCCRRFSIGYLRHLFKMNDSLFMRLATIHNLRFMVQLTDRLRKRADEQAK